MAFTTTQDERPTAVGNLVMMHGTFTSDSGSTGGPIPITGLRTIVAAGFWASAAATGPTANTHDVNEALGVMTIETEANATGKWWALGVRA